MTTQTKQEPGLLRPSQWRTPKSLKVTTTVRIDSDLKKQAEEFARVNHMDFSTFLTFSLHTTIQNGGKIEPRMSDEKYAYYQKIIDQVDSGLVATDRFASIDEMRVSYKN